MTTPTKPAQKPKLSRKSAAIVRRALAMSEERRQRMNTATPEQRAALYKHGLEIIARSRGLSIADERHNREFLQLDLRHQHMRTRAGKGLRVAKSTPKLPDKLRMVPPGRPPVGYRWCKRGEPCAGASMFDIGAGDIIETGTSQDHYRVGDRDSDLGDGIPIVRPFIRPLSQPKRAEKNKRTIVQMAFDSAWRQQVCKGDREKGIYLAAFRAGYRAANRRAK